MESLTVSTKTSRKMHDKGAKYFFDLLLSLSLMALLMGTAGAAPPAGGADTNDNTPVNVSVDWSKTLSTTTPWSYGINAPKAVETAIIGNTHYRNGMNFLKAGTVRVMDQGETETDDTYGKSWVKDDGKGNRGWNASRIGAQLDAIKTFAPTDTLVLNVVSRWPSTTSGGVSKFWWPLYNVTDPSHGNVVVSSNLLRTDQFANLAKFCATFVKIVNKDQKRSIKHFELFNEFDDMYYGNIVDYNAAHGTKLPDHLDELITMYNQCAAAMKAVDATITVGGPAFARPDRTDMVNRFARDTTANLGFMSGHLYASGNKDDSNKQIYDRAAGTAGEGGRRMRQACDTASSSRHIPVHVNEYNISWSWEIRDPRMLDNHGAVYDALSMIYLHQNGIDSTSAWHEANEIYGKLNPGATPTPFIPYPGGAGYLWSLMNQYMVGSRVSSVTSSEQRVVPFAVKTANGRYSFVLVNRSEQAVKVPVNFKGWMAPATFALYQIKKGAYTTTSATLTSVNSGLTLPDNSVTVFTAASG